MAAGTWCRRPGSRGQLRVQLEGVDDRDVALALAGCWVQIARDELPQPAPREHYREDLIGLAAVNAEGVQLGAVSHFVELPAGVVMVVRGAREHWVPASPPHLRKVDLAAGQVLVDWPDDL
jgi:16S rRNA processing protein RimM